MTTSAPTGWWTKPRLLRALFSVFAAIGIGAFCVVRSDGAQKSMLLCGDFPGFYAPAVILAEGSGERLYDRPLQRTVENRFWPAMEGRVLVSVYPAFVSALLRPLAGLPPLAAKFVFGLLALGGILGFAFLALPPKAKAAYGAMTAGLLLVLFPPNLISVLGGQNTGITLGLLGLLAYGVRSGTKRGESLSGVALALLLYKPQFGLFLVLPFLLQRKWRVLAYASVTAVALFFLPIPWTGGGWIVAWINAVAAFAPENFAVNGSRMISPMAFLETMWGDGYPLRLAGAALTLVLYLCGLRRYLRAPAGTRADELLKLAAICAFLSPQALFYDLGLVAPLLLLDIAKDREGGMWRFIGWSALTACAFLFLDRSGIPLFFLVGGLLLLSQRVKPDSNPA